MESFVQTKSIGRRLTITIILCSVLFIFEFAGIFIASRESLRSMTEMYQTVRATTAVRQVRTLINVRGEIIRKSRIGPLVAEEAHVFNDSRAKIEELLLATLQFTAATSEAHRLVLEAEQRLTEIELKSQDILNSRGDVKSNLLLIEQFVLEAHDLLSRAQLVLSQKSGTIFNSIYERRYMPLAVSICLALLFGILAIVIGFGFKTRLQHSIGSLLEATRSVTTGNLSSRAKIHDSDEIGLLAHAFNKMAASLQDSTVSKAYVENIFESMLDGVLVLHGSGTIMRANREAEKIFGYSRDQLFGTNISSLLKNFQLRDGLQNTEVEGVTKDGSYLPVFVSVAPLENKNRESEYKVCVIKDITDRKKYEEELSERNQALLHANKELEAFSYSVSHDLRAPLRGIDGFSQALIEDYGGNLPPEAIGYLERIRSGVQKMGHLIDDILGLAKISRSPMAFKSTDLAVIAESVVEELKEQDPQRKDVEFRIQKDLKAAADPILMRSTLENLLGNAWKYTAKNEDVVIEFGVLDLYGKKTYFVRDNGTGFDMAYADKIFAPFQRLHRQEEFPGTGVGLASAQRIIRRHGGTIWAESEVGKGATFYFTLG